MNSIEQQDHNDAESARPVSPEAAPPRAHTACKLFAQIAELRALLSRSSDGRTTT